MLPIRRSQSVMRSHTCDIRAFVLDPMVITYPGRPRRNRELSNLNISWPFMASLRLWKLATERDDWMALKLDNIKQTPTLPQHCYISETARSDTVWSFCTYTFVPNRRSSGMRTSAKREVQIPNKHKQRLTFLIFLTQICIKTNKAKIKTKYFGINCGNILNRRNMK